MCFGPEVTLGFGTEILHESGIAAYASKTSLCPRAWAQKQDYPSFSTADGMDPTTDGQPPRRRPGPIALSWPRLVPLRRVLPGAHLPTTGRLPGMSSAGVPGVRTVDLPKDHH